MRRLTTIGACAFLTGVGAAGLAITQDDPSTAQDPAAQTLASDQPRHYSLDALSDRLTRRFGILRGEAAAPDQLPKNALEVSGTYGAIPDAARRARETGRGSLYVIPGANERICLMDENGAGGCTKLAAVEQLGSLLTTRDHWPGLRRGEVEIQGLVPDGIHSVTVRLRDGTDRRIGVLNNVFVDVLPSGPDSVTLDNGRTLKAPWMP